ncbi:Uncharacterised protein [Mycobacteroides abscessus subsp. abscessus]|nr:Uncharacterised protein [Mycobacteroides abscessus subsp. abscessus]
MRASSVADVPAIAMSRIPAASTLPHDRVIVLVSLPSRIASRTGGSASSPIPACGPATVRTW